MLTQYKYKAVDKTGTQIEGTLSAETKDRTIEFLSEQSLIPIEIEKVNEKKHYSILGFFKTGDYENLIIFTNSLATLIKSGIPIIRALNLIKIGDAKNKINDVIQSLRARLQSGITLSEAMAEHPKTFPKVYTASIAAGEESGKLDEILIELSPILEKELELTRQIKSGIRYPLMVVTALGCAFLVLILFVLPRFVDFFSGFNTELPLPTRILMGVSELFVKNWLYLMIASIAVSFGFSKFLKNENGRLWFDTKLLKIPLIGSIIIKGNVARFVLLFSILLKAGIPITKALMLLRDSVKNTRMSLELKMIENMFVEGREHKIVSKEFEYFPEMARQMMYIGLESGALDSILTESGNHYAKEVQYQSKQITSYLEPILTFVLGIFVLIMALAIFLPMWNLITIFKN